MLIQVSLNIQSIKLKMQYNINILTRKVCRNARESMSARAEVWENRKLFKVQRVRVKPVLEGSQGQADFASSMKVTATPNHLFHFPLYQSLNRKYLISHSHCTDDSLKMNLFRIINEPRHLIFQTVNIKFWI